jgi:hypothetical protein
VATHDDRLASQKRSLCDGFRLAGPLEAVQAARQEVRSSRLESIIEPRGDALAEGARRLVSGSRLHHPLSSSVSTSGWDGSRREFQMTRPSSTWGREAAGPGEEIWIGVIRSRLIGRNSTEVDPSRASASERRT